VPFGGWIPALVPMAFSLGSFVANAQTYSVAFAKYQRTDFVGSEASANQALARETNVAARARLLKLRGMAEFSRGEPNAAAQSFRDALALSPAIKVESAEALDPKVILFFERQRSTLMIVESNVSAGSVAIDGIIAGPVNTKLNIGAGTRTVAVTAKGYVAKQLRMQINSGVENRLTVNLERVQLIARTPKARPRKKREVYAPIPNDEVLSARRPSGAVDEFERDIAGAGASGLPVIPPGSTVYIVPPGSSFSPLDPSTFSAGPQPRPPSLPPPSWGSNGELVEPLDPALEPDSEFEEDLGINKRRRRR
jgi:hypothetical protein